MIKTIAASLFVAGALLPTGGTVGAYPPATTEPPPTTILASSGAVAPTTTVAAGTLPRTGSSGNGGTIAVATLLVVAGVGMFASSKARSRSTESP
jgi:LPXTG-motif cell wall-anchored protein